MLDGRTAFAASATTACSPAVVVAITLPVPASSSPHHRGRLSRTWHPSPRAIGRLAPAVAALCSSSRSSSAALSHTHRHDPKFSNFGLFDGSVKLLRSPVIGRDPVPAATWQTSGVVHILLI